MSTINFGSIRKQPLIAFKDIPDDRVPANRRDDDDMFWSITAHERFRRWKIARKAWRSRKK